MSVWKTVVSDRRGHAAMRSGYRCRSEAGRLRLPVRGAAQR